MTLILICAALATAVALVCGILLAAGKPVPPVVSVFALLLPLAAGWWVGGPVVFDTRAMPPMLVINEVGQAMAEGLWATHLAAWASLPAAVVLLLGAAVGGVRGSQRKLGLAVATLVVGSFLVLASIWSLGQLEHHPYYAWAKIPAYTVALWLAAVAMLAGDPERSGPESAASGGLAVLVIVTAWELAQLANSNALALDVMSLASLEMRWTLFMAGGAIGQAELGYAVTNISIASVIAGLGVGVAASTEGLRRNAAVLAALALLVPVALVLSARSDTALYAAVHGAHDRVLPRESDQLLLPAGERRGYRPGLISTVTVTQERALVNGVEVAVKVEGDRGWPAAKLADGQLTAVRTPLEEDRAAYAASFGEPGPFKVKVAIDKRTSWKTAAPVLAGIQGAGMGPAWLIQSGGGGLPFAWHTPALTGPTSDLYILRVDPTGMVLFDGPDWYVEECSPKPCAAPETLPIREVLERISELKRARRPAKPLSTSYGLRGGSTSTAPAVVVVPHDSLSWEQVLGVLYGLDHRARLGVYLSGSPKFSLGSGDHLPTLEGLLERQAQHRAGSGDR